MTLQGKLEVLEKAAEEANTHGLGVSVLVPDVHVFEESRPSFWNI